jgi:hypothetical protein
MGGVTAVAACLIVANAAFVALPAGDGSGLPTRVVKQLSMGQEGNFATWFRSMVLALNGLCAYAMWRRWTGRRLPGASAALLMAAGFLALSADDVIQFHEACERAVRGLLGWRGQGDERFGYVGLAFPGVLAAALACWVAWFCSFAATVDNRQWAWGAVVLVGVAMAAELIYRSLGCVYLSACYRAEVLFEEGASLGAALAFLQFQRRVLAAAAWPASPDRAAQP